MDCLCSCWAKTLFIIPRQHNYFSHCWNERSYWIKTSGFLLHEFGSLKSCNKVLMQRTLCSLQTPSLFFTVETTILSCKAHKAKVSSENSPFRRFLTLCPKGCFFVGPGLNHRWRVKTELWGQLDLGLIFPFKTYVFRVEDISVVEHLLSLACMRV